MDLNVRLAAGLSGVLFSMVTSHAWACNGIWAATAGVYQAKRTTKVYAPDRSAAITFAEQGLQYTVQGAAYRLDVPVNPLLAEVLWSPDSRHFALTASDGGVVGSWNASIYAVSSTGLLAVDLGSALSSEAKQLARCKDPEDANLGVVAWLDHGRSVLMVAEVPPHSSCSNMGEIAGFIVSIQTKRIIRRVAESELRVRWKKQLGCRFY